jgi:hypothetical protein
VAKFDVEQHDRVFKDTLDEIQDGVYDNAKALENSVAELVSQGLPVDSLRPEIDRLFQQSSGEIRSSADVLTDLSDDVLEQSSLPVDTGDAEAESVLLESSQDELSATVSGHAEDVIKTAVLGTVAGLATAVIVEQVRGRISGVQMESSNPVVRKLQRQLRTEIVTNGRNGKVYTSLVGKIKDRLPGSVNTAANLATKLNTNAESVVGSYNGTFIKSRAVRNEIERFEYSGGLMATSRPFCRSMLGAILTEEEIFNIWDGESWAGKEPGDPFVVRGGYNCQHYFVPVEDDEEV